MGRQLCVEGWKRNGRNGRLIWKGALVVTRWSCVRALLSFRDKWRWRMEIQVVSVPGVRWGGGSRISEEMDVWKMETLFLLFSNYGVYRFLERGTNVRFVPCRGDMSWEGGRFKSTPRAKLYQHPNVVAITKNSRSFSHGKEGNHTLLHYRHALINTLIFLAYLVPEDQSALQQVMGEEREANSWCLQLQRETEDGEETLKSLLQMLTELWVDS